jgi:hypothetical protein
MSKFASLPLNYGGIVRCFGSRMRNLFPNVLTTYDIACRAFVTQASGRRRAVFIDENPSRHSSALETAEPVNKMRHSRLKLSYEVLDWVIFIPSHTLARRLIFL